MQNAGNTSIQFQRLKLISPAIQKKLFIHAAFFCANLLCGRDQIDQDFLCLYCFSHQQMTQISFMAHPMVKWNILRSEICYRCTQDLAVVIIHNPTFIHSYNVIETSPLVHTKCQRTILYFITKRIFHFISVTKLLRTFSDSLKNILRIWYHCFHQFQHLSGFQF